MITFLIDPAETRRKHGETENEQHGIITKKSGEKLKTQRNHRERNENEFKRSGYGNAHPYAICHKGFSHNEEEHGEAESEARNHRERDENELQAGGGTQGFGLFF